MKPKQYYSFPIKHIGIKVSKSTIYLVGSLNGWVIKGFSEKANNGKESIFHALKWLFTNYEATNIIIPTKIDLNEWINQARLSTNSKQTNDILNSLLNEHELMVISFFGDLNTGLSIYHTMKGIKDNNNSNNLIKKNDKRTQMGIFYNIFMHCHICICLYILYFLTYYIVI